jgi:hypothetical protein
MEKPPTAAQFLKKLSDHCGGFRSRERSGIVTNSELKRWCERRSVIMNGEPVEPRELIDFEIWSLVLFPKGRRVTLI